MIVYHLPQWRFVCQTVFHNSHVVSYAPSRFLSSSPPSIKPTHFLSDIKRRLGKCILFGLKGKQIHDASQIAKILAQEWSGLVADYTIGAKSNEVRWGEMDSMGHVNNVVYLRYAESSRIEWFRNLSSTVPPKYRKEWGQLLTPQGIGLILKSATINFKLPMTFPSSFSTNHRLVSTVNPGTDTIFFDCMVLSHSHQRSAATIREEIVCYDYRQGKRVPLELYMIDVIRAQWQKEHNEKLEWRTRRAAVENMITSLEQNTWAMPGAKEDLGSAQ